MLRMFGELPSIGRACQEGEGRKQDRKQALSP